MAELTDEATDQVHGDVGSRIAREDQSKVCEPCQGDDTIQPATGWCETCNELLCNDCYKSHCRPKMMKTHQLWSLDQMSRRRQTKKVASKCDKHEGEKLKYYCEDHTELGCSQCFVSKHRQCSNVVCISEVTTRDSTEFKAMQLLLSKLEKRLKIIKEKNEINASITERQHDKTVLGIHEAGEKLKTLIDNLVKKAIAKAEMIKEDNIRNTGKVGGMQEKVEEELTTAREMIAAVKGDNNQLFITMKHLQGEAKLLESKLHETEQKNNIKKYDFVLNSELARLLDTVTELGNLKDIRVLNMDKATDEVVDEFEMRRLQRDGGGTWHQYDGIHSDAIQMSTDRDIRLLYVLLYPCNGGDTNVKINIHEGKRHLIHCTSTHPNTDEDVMPVKVVGHRSVHGITLQACHWYDVALTITGNMSQCGCNGLADVTAQGVKFSFRTSSLSKGRTTVESGQIPGFRFNLL